MRSLETSQIEPSGEIVHTAEHEAYDGLRRHNSLIAPVQEVMNETQYVEEEKKDESIAN